MYKSYVEAYNNLHSTDYYGWDCNSLLFINVLKARRILETVSVVTETNYTSGDPVNPPIVIYLS